MAVDKVLYTGVNSSRGPSPIIWSKAPVMDFINDPSKGMYFFDDFLLTGQMPDASGAAVVSNMGAWGVYAAQGGRLVDAALEGGVINIASDGDQESVTLASLVGAYRLVTTSTLAYNQALWFECSVALGTIATTKSDCFIGLADTLTTSNLLVNTKPISTTDDALSTACNLIGFHRKSGTGNDWSFVYQLAGGTAVYPTGLTTLVTTATGSAATANTLIKLGFLFNPAAAKTTITTASTGQTAGQLVSPVLKVFVNGIPLPAFLTSTNLQGGAFPTGFMGPVISNMQTATGSNALLCDWIRVAQAGNS